MKTIDEINAELLAIAEEIRQEQTDAEYEDFMDLMYYCLECEQYDRDMELYNEFG